MSEAALYMYWVGMDIPADTDAAGVAAFNQHYSKTHVPEVLANNPGFVRGTRYEIFQDDPRGRRGPRFLAVYDIDSEAGVHTYIQRNDGPPSGRPTYTQGPPGRPQNETPWRLMWRRIAMAPAHATIGEAPYIFMIGMNIPANANAAEVAEFNDFYTKIHMPEVMAASGFDNGVRYESVREFRHPDPGGPRFLVIYDIKSDAAAQAHMESRTNPRPGGSALSEGPLVWQRHDTLWRLTYRRIP